jgi:hypothetical protein
MLGFDVSERTVSRYLPGKRPRPDARAARISARRFGAHRERAGQRAVRRTILVREAVEPRCERFQGLHSWGRGHNLYENAEVEIEAIRQSAQPANPKPSEALCTPAVCSFRSREF